MTYCRNDADIYDLTADKVVNALHGMQRLSEAGLL